MSRAHPRPLCRFCRMGPPFGASPSMRMTASWSPTPKGSYRIQGCCGTLGSAAAGELPSDPIGSDDPDGTARPKQDRAVLAAVKAASRRLRRWPAASLDDGCARRDPKPWSGRRNGPVVEPRNCPTRQGTKKNLTTEKPLDLESPIQGWAKRSVPSVSSIGPLAWAGFRFAHLTARPWRRSHRGSGASGRRCAAPGARSARPAARAAPGRPCGRFPRCRGRSA